MTTAAVDMMRHGTMQTSVYSDGRMLDHVLGAESAVSFEDRCVLNCVTGHTCGHGVFNFDSLTSTRPRHDVGNTKPKADKDLAERSRNDARTMTKHINRAARNNRPEIAFRWTPNGFGVVTAGETALSNLLCSVPLSRTSSHFPPRRAARCARGFNVGDAAWMDTLTNRQARAVQFRERAGHMKAGHSRYSSPAIADTFFNVGGNRGEVTMADCRSAAAIRGERLFVCVSQPNRIGCVELPFVHIQAGVVEKHAAGCACGRREPSRQKRCMVVGHSAIADTFSNVAGILKCGQLRPAFFYAEVA